LSSGFFDRRHGLDVRVSSAIIECGMDYDLALHDDILHRHQGFETTPKLRNSFQN